MPSEDGLFLIPLLRQEKESSAAREAKKLNYYFSGRREEDEAERRDAYGLCGKCAFFNYRVHVRDGNEDTTAVCGAWDIRLTTDYKVKDCSIFRQKGMVPIQALEDKAILIGPDVEEEKEKKRVEEKKKAQIQTDLAGGYL